MKPLALIVLSLIRVPAVASDLTYYIKLDVSAPAVQRDTLVSAISQNLRRYPDVQLVTANQTFALSLTCVQVSDMPVLACGFMITRPFDAQFWKTIVLPQNDVGWTALLSSMESANLEVFETVQVVGFDRMKSLADQVTDTLNSRFLEVVRQAVTTYERRSPK